MLRYLFGTCILVVAMACSASKSHLQGATSGTPALVRYFPLEVGNSWTYDVTIERHTIPAALRVQVTDVQEADRESGGPIYVLSVVDESVAPEHRLDEPVLYAIRSGEGAFCLKCEGYILREPLVVGNTWTAGQAEGTGGTYRIVATAETVKVGASTYRDCLTVEKNEPSLDRRILTAYCPGVGPVYARFFNMSAGGRPQPYREEALTRFSREPIPSRGK